MNALDLHKLEAEIQEKYVGPVQANAEKAKKVAALVKQLREENAQLKRALAEKEEKPKGSAPSAAAARAVPKKMLRVGDLNVQLTDGIEGEASLAWAKIREVFKVHKEYEGVSNALVEARAMSLKADELGTELDGLESCLSGMQHALPELFKTMVNQLETLGNQIMIPLARTEEGDIYIDRTLLAEASYFAKKTKGIYPVALTYGDRVFKIV